jgi:two-component system cell cycle sensor histidine kinase PleC
VKIFERQVAEKHIDAAMKISADLPAIVSDSDHFARILGHLLSNAVKFTGNNGKIELSALVDGFGDLRIDVRDSGIGMSSDDIQLALTPFGRLHSATGTDPFGVGLGLPLANKFTRLLGGTFQIESTPGTGTCISMKFGKNSVFQPAGMRLSA